MAFAYTFQIRCTREEQTRIKQIAEERGFKDATAMVRYYVFGEKVPAKEQIKRVPGRALLKKNPKAAFGRGERA